MILQNDDWQNHEEIGHVDAWSRLVSDDFGHTFSVPSCSKSIRGIGTEDFDMKDSQMT